MAVSALATCTLRHLLIVINPAAAGSIRLPVRQHILQVKTPSDTECVEQQRMITSDSLPVHHLIIWQTSQKALIRTCVRHKIYNLQGLHLVVASFSTGDSCRQPRGGPSCCSPPPPMYNLEPTERQPDHL